MFLGELPTQFAPGGGPWRKHGGACTGRRMVREVGGDVGGGYATQYYASQPSLHPSTIDRLACRGGPGPGPGPAHLPLHALDPEVPFFKGPDPPLVTAHRSGLQSAPLSN
ncbi:hypothetical protein CKAH01_10453 [Colletotrichum kahawae]|uniref:Uncharacterized protein n=1 Tax=Colletotrichum kahawae TaxID=34407 RepID=A0AAD9XWZ1_COLKA|nr:hypothetical protein CKAH01_10453 [Colletotrichum kahawae]